MNGLTYHGGDGGYTKGYYTDSWGGIVSEEEVAKAKLKEELKRETKPNICCRCCARVEAGAKVCPYCGKENPV